MPATRQSSPSAPVKTSNILVFSGLSLLVLLISICVAIRRGQTQRHRQAIALALSPSKAPNRPSLHDVHLTTWAGPGATGAPIWCSVQPLAIQALFPEPMCLQSHRENRWPSIKRSGVHPSLSSRSETSIDTTPLATLLEEFPAESFERHLHIAVLIAMPFRPGMDAGDSSLLSCAADNMTIGIADTVFPTS
ncbi:hypothetical protein DFH08DRAFT_361299 [Mycena albidolilacea]|uniref:Uncharacterized protein n=1 Tax=Mycena albidolilacea TaxID=1033008 RepID=A0AAD7EZZ7_9AGAR|nr:hypothetical protein DFH08DRAFT_361299 [Mycena albidolilacea]